MSQLSLRFTPAVNVTARTFSDYGTCSYVALRIIIGHHFTNLAQIVFGQVGVRFTNLDLWATREDFNIEKSEDNVSIQYSTPAPIALFSTTGISVTLEWKLVGNVSKGKTRFVQVRQQSWMVFRFDEEQPLSIVEDWVSRANIFLNLATMKECAPIKINCYTTQCLEPGPENTFCPMKLDFLLLLRNKPQRHAQHSARKMLFTLADLRAGKQDLFKRCIEASEPLKLVQNLYFATLYSPSMYLNHKFLGFVQALESYVRSSVPDFEDEARKTAHAKNVALTIAALPKLKSWLEDKLSYVGEMSLQEKLQWALDSLAPLSHRIIPDQTTFIRNAKHTRHFLTHFDPKLKKKALAGQELHFLTEQVRLVLELCLLSALDFGQEELTAFLRRTQHLVVLPSNTG